MKKFTKTLLATGMIFALNSTTFAAPAEPVNKDKIKVEPVKIEKVEVEKTPEKQKQPKPARKSFKIQWNEPEEIEQPEFLVAGVVRDIAQRILPVSVEARFYAPHMNLNVKSDNTYYSDGGDVSLKGDLGFGNNNAPEVILRYKRFTADYMSVNGTGDKDLGIKPVTFAGHTFFGNEHSKSKFQYLKLTLTNPIISILGTSVNWNVGIAAMHWKGKMTEVSTGDSESKTYKAPVPFIGVGGQVSPTPSLRVYANLSGLPLGGFGHFYDFEAGVRYSPLEILGVTVGYRRINARLEHNDKECELTLNGPFAGLRVDF